MSIKLLPRELRVVENGESFMLLPDKSLFKLAEKYQIIALIDEEERLYLFGTDDGYVLAQKDESETLNCICHGDWIDLISKEPAMVKYLPFEKLRDGEFVKLALKTAMESYLNIIKNESDHEKKKRLVAKGVALTKQFETRLATALKNRGVSEIMTHKNFTADSSDENSKE